MQEQVSQQAQQQPQQPMYNQPQQPMPGQYQQPMYAQPQKPKSSNGCLKAFLIFLGICFFIGVISNIFGGNDTTASSKGSDSLSNEVNDSTKKTAENNPLTWNYDVTIDEMTDSENRFATIESINYIEQDFPYSGKTRAGIAVRYMKKYGTDVLISITQGQIIGDNYRGDNYVNVRFGDSEPKKYYFNHAADLSSETIFITKSKDFIERCKSAKDIKIEIPLYQGGRPVFSFHVDETLNW